LAGELKPVKVKAIKRSDLGGKIYTSTEYPSSQTIPFHNEYGYATEWPMTLMLYSEIIAESGGATPLADCRLVLRNMPEELLARFQELGIRYVRNFGYLPPPIGFTWQEAYETEDKKEVERTCEESGINFEWDGECLHTWWVQPAVRKHPDLDTEVWFNQLLGTHLSSMPALVRERLAASGEEYAPRNCFYGDGTRIEDDESEVIRQLYEEAKTEFVWKKNDYLIFDNMLVAHSRKPFRGARRVLLAIADQLP
jgi:alpha-ketoglutarate-dependent taurine dioxygenase